MGWWLQIPQNRKAGVCVGMLVSLSSPVGSAALDVACCLAICPETKQQTCLGFRFPRQPWLLAGRVARPLVRAGSPVPLVLAPLRLKASANPPFPTCLLYLSRNTPLVFLFWVHTILWLHSQMLTFFVFLKIQILK